MRRCAPTIPTPNPRPLLTPGRRQCPRTHLPIQRIPSRPGTPRSPGRGRSVNDYNQEFTDEWDRTLRLGLALPPIRLQVHKDCIDLAKALPVIVDYFNQHSSDKLRVRTSR